MGNSKKLDELPDVLTVQLVKQYLGIGINQTYALLHAGQIRFRRIGPRYLVPREALREYLAGSDAHGGSH